MDQEQQGNYRKKINELTDQVSYLEQDKEITSLLNLQSVLITALTYEDGAFPYRLNKKKN